MRLKYSYTTRVVFCPEIGQHNFLLRCLPAQEPFQQLLEQHLLLPGTFWHKEGRDGYGNRIISGGTSERHSLFEFESRGVLEMTTYCIPDPLPHPMYRQAMPLKAAPAERVYDIMHHVHEYLDYCPGSTCVDTPLDEVLRTRRGVCQDFAHMMIDLCRREGFAARYVCGMMMGEGQTHAWVEVHDGQCWYAYDPTNDTAVASGYIKLAHGRSALDCPVCRGTYMGVTTETNYVNVMVDRLAE